MSRPRLPASKRVAAYVALLRQYNGSVPWEIRKKTPIRTRIAAIYRFTHAGRNPRAVDLPPTGSEDPAPPSH